MIASNQPVLQGSRPSSPESFQALDEMCLDASASFLVQAKRILSGGDCSRLLNGIALTRTPKGYSRTLIYGGQGISAWAFAWAPGCATPIHDHHCFCCYAVVSGQLTEACFQHLQDNKVTARSIYQRGPGFVAGVLPTQPNIHQMRNDSSTEAISIHVYGFDQSMRDNSIGKEYELAS